MAMTCPKRNVQQFCFNLISSLVLGTGSNMTTGKGTTVDSSGFGDQLWDAAVAAKPPMAQGGGIPIIAKDGSINGGMPGPKGIMPTGGKLGGS